MCDGWGEGTLHHQIAVVIELGLVGEARRGVLCPLVFGGWAGVVPVLERADWGGLDLLIGGCQMGRWGFGQCT